MQKRQKLVHTVPKSIALPNDQHVLKSKEIEPYHHLKTMPADRIDDSHTLMRNVGTCLELLLKED
jgi:hypothetical protein